MLPCFADAQVLPIVLPIVLVVVIVCIVACCWQGKKCPCNKDDNKKKNKRESRCHHHKKNFLAINVYVICAEESEDAENAENADKVFVENEKSKASNMSSLAGRQAVMERSKPPKYSTSSHTTTVNSRYNITARARLQHYILKGPKLCGRCLPVTYSETHIRP